MSRVSKNSQGAQVHGAALMQSISLPQHLLEGGKCAQVELAHTLTLHLRSRTFPTRRAHASTVRLLADLADRAAGRTPAVGSRPITSVCPLILCAAADMFRPMQRAPKSCSHHMAEHYFTVSPVPAPPVWPGPRLVRITRLVRPRCTCRLSSNLIHLCRLADASPCAQDVGA